MRRTTFLFLATLISLTVVLVSLARQGDIWAASILAALWTMFAVVVGAFIVTYVTRQRDIQQNADFTLNIKENLLIMQHLQRLQNEQNKGLMNHVGQRPETPQKTGLLIEEGTFDELD